MFADADVKVLKRTNESSNAGDSSNVRDAEIT
jgi:hypothetical protein